MAARGEGSVDVGGGGGGGGGRVSSSTEPIQTRNLSYQFLLGGVAKSSPVRLGVRYINAIQKFCRPRRGRARVSTASRGSHRHHRRPTTPTIISLSLSLSTEIFVVFLFECTRITWPNTLPAEFLRLSFHRVEYLFGRLIALVPPRSPAPCARAALLIREEGRRGWDDGASRRIDRRWMMNRFD